MVNNTEQIRSMLQFDSEDTFYFLQIFKRRKDNPNMAKDMIVLANYCVKSLDHFDKLVPDVVKQCQDNNARAYFRLNRRSYRKTSLEALKMIAGYIVEGNYRAVRKAFDSAAGTHHSDPDKTWIIDIDYLDIEGDHDQSINEVIHSVQTLIAETGRDDTVWTVNSKNGIHLICRPFNLQKFKIQYPKIDVHKDNPTILYAN
jgi:hypothetical protein